ncbi:hypothetical protein HII13_003875 [Brettanomyces bruxellensis]|nr:hypothetical protein HII13_003875 [Brettanomyces bruxellensis]
MDISNDLMDTGVSDITSKLSSFNLGEDPMSTTQITSVRLDNDPSLRTPLSILPNYLSQMNTPASEISANPNFMGNEPSNASLDDSRYSIHKGEIYDHPESFLHQQVNTHSYHHHHHRRKSTHTPATPLEDRLKSLNLHPTADFPSRIPKMSPSVSSTSSFCDEDEENTPSKMYASFQSLNMKLSETLSPETPVSRLPIPKFRGKLHKLSNERLDSSNLSSRRKKHYSMGDFLMPPSREKHQSQKLGSPFKPKAIEEEGSARSGNTSVQPNIQHSTPRQVVQQYSQTHPNKAKPARPSFHYMFGRKECNSNKNTPSRIMRSTRFDPSFETPSRQPAHPRNDTRKAKKHMSLPVFDGRVNVEQGMLHFSPANEQHQHLRSMKRSSIERTREKRLAAIKETGEMLSLSSPDHCSSKSMLPRFSFPHRGNVRRRSLGGMKSPSKSPARKQLNHWNGRVSTDSELRLLLKEDKKLGSLYQIYAKSLNCDSAPEMGLDVKSLAVRKPALYGKLNVYERGEIINQQTVYFLGLDRNQKPKVDGQSFKTNFGFDGPDNNYKCTVGDHIQFRYEIQHILGKGTFGEVISVYDHKTGGVYALKIVTNQMEWTLQAVNEVKYMKMVSEKKESRNVLQYLDHFHFRSHMCILTELLSVNLFQVIEATKFKGLGMSLVRSFSADILRGLHYIHSAGIVHCDMKPENLMLAYDNAKSRFIVKIIDFGSSCKNGQPVFSYLQSRYYRAPEICLGARYDEKIDIWSFGAIVVELFAGMPIFQVQDEYGLLNEFLSYFGPPSRNYIMHLREEMLQKGPITSYNDSRSTKADSINYNTLLWTAFNSEGFINLHHLIEKSPMHKFRASTKTVVQFLMRHSGLNRFDTRQLVEVRELADFVQLCFSWNRDFRADCSHLLKHRFLSSVRV